MITLLGVYPVTAKMYLLEYFYTLSKAIMIFNLIFKIIIEVFTLISILLLNSLLMIGIEKKSYEIGLFRMIGETKIGAVTMIMIQAFMFTLPAIFCAFVVIIPILSIIYSQVFDRSLDEGFEPIPSFKAF